MGIHIIDIVAALVKNRGNIKEKAARSGFRAVFCIPMGTVDNKTGKTKTVFSSTVKIPLCSNNRINAKQSVCEAYTAL